MIASLLYFIVADIEIFADTLLIPTNVTKEFRKFDSLTTTFIMVRATTTTVSSLQVVLTFLLAEIVRKHGVVKRYVHLLLHLLHCMALPRGIIFSLSLLKHLLCFLVAVTILNGR